MRQVPGTTLWIGAVHHARQSPDVIRRGIVAIVDLAINELPLAPARELVYCRVPLDDGGGNDPAVVRFAIQSTAHFLREQEHVLVCCSMGMSRSPGIGAGGLAIARSMEPAAALVMVCENAAADVSPALWRAVVDAVAAARES